jgi:hypothetical protein
METIRGKVSRELDFNGLKERLAGYKHILLDLGTGDGRYVHFLAEQRPHWFVIGADPCRENLHEHSRARLPNMLFIIASAQDLPCELNGLVSHVTLNFPWGNLLESLLIADPSLMDGLGRISYSVASVDVRLNSGALAETGKTLEFGASQICDNLFRSGWLVNVPKMMDASALRTFPSTWARRLAFGRDPRALAVSAGIATETRSAVYKITTA